MVRIAVSLMVSSLVLCSPICPMRYTVFTTRAMAQVVTVRDDVRVTPAIDPDPADETSIAVSTLDPQVIFWAAPRQTRAQLASFITIRQMAGTHGEPDFWDSTLPKRCSLARRIRRSLRTRTETSIYAH